MTEGERRWNFEVEVQSGCIAHVRVERPDDGEYAVDGRDEFDAQLVPLGMVACPCYGRATLGARGQFQICPVCYWEDDGQDSHDADVERLGPNSLSLTRASELPRVWCER